MLAAGTNCGPVAEDVLIELARIDEELAAITISEVACNGSKQCISRLQKAVIHLQDGQDRLQDQEINFEKTIDNFENAWKEAIKALDGNLWRTKAAGTGRAVSRVSVLVDAEAIKEDAMKCDHEWEVIEWYRFCLICGESGTA